MQLKLHSYILKQAQCILSKQTIKQIKNSSFTVLGYLKELIINGEGKTERSFHATLKLYTWCCCRHRCLGVCADNYFVQNSLLSFTYILHLVKEEHENFPIIMVLLRQLSMWQRKKYVILSSKEERLNEKERCKK